MPSSSKHQCLGRIQEGAEDARYESDLVMIVNVADGVRDADRQRGQ